MSKTSEREEDVHRRALNLIETLFDPAFLAEQEVLRASTLDNMKSCVRRMRSDPRVNLVLWNISDCFSAEEKHFLDSGRFYAVRQNKPEPKLAQSIKSKIIRTIFDLNELEICLPSLIDQDDLQGAIRYQNDQYIDSAFHFDNGIRSLQISDRILCTLTLALAGTPTHSVQPQLIKEYYAAWRKMIIDKRKVPGLNGKNIQSTTEEILPSTMLTSLTSFVRTQLANSGSKSTDEINHDQLTIGIHSNGGCGHAPWFHRASRAAKHMSRVVLVSSGSMPPLQL